MYPKLHKKKCEGNFSTKLKTKFPPPNCPLMTPTPKVLQGGGGSKGGLWGGGGGM